MRRNLPGKNELLLLVTMAVACTGLMAVLPSTGSGLFFLTFPLFTASAILGLWKSGRLGPSDD